MKTHKTRSIIFFAAILFALPCISRAQSPSTDTILKVIFGVGNTASITFDDPNGSSNHIELRVLDTPGGLDISPTSADSIIHKSFVVTARQPGEYTVELKFRSDTIRAKEDSGTLYVRVIVLRNVPLKFGAVTGWGNDVTDMGIVELPKGDNVIEIVNNELLPLPSDTLLKFPINLSTAVSPPVLVVSYERGGKINYDGSFWAFDDAAKDHSLVIASDAGSLFHSVLEPHIGWSIPWLINTLPLGPGDHIINIREDDLYVLTTQSLYVSRDYGKTLAPDTAGLNGAFLNAIDLDSSGNLYLATSAGLLRQAPKMNNWTPLSLLPITSVSKVFIDHRDRIIAGGLNNLYISTDRGAHWTIDTTGLGGSFIAKFGQDGAGNLYAITSTAFYPNQVFRSRGGTGPWQEIAQSVRALAIDSSQSNVFHAIAGNRTALLLATVFGLYRSTDQGDTWVEAKQGLPALNLYTIVKSSDGSSFVSTNRGIYQGFFDDTNWTKRYPVNGFMNGAPLFRDNGGILYTLGGKRSIGYNTKQQLTYRSIDNGKTWIVDTLGLDANISTIGNWYVDVSGMQHLAVGQYKQRLHLFAKPGGSSWVKDEQGFLGDSSTQGNFVGADRQGNVYLRSNGLSWKRAPGSGTWAIDTAGLNGDALGLVTGGKNGEVYTSTYYGGLMRWTGSRWSAIPGAAGVASTGVISVDSSGALFAHFYRKVGNSLVSGGVYFTSDNGAHWAFAGLDGITIGSLISYGDTTYTLTNQGIFALTRNGNSSVRTPIIFADPNIQLSLYPNPSSGKTTIKISSAERGVARVTITNLLGEEVAKLFEGELDAGEHSFVWDAKNLPTGIYSCTVRINSSLQTMSMSLTR